MIKLVTTHPRHLQAVQPSGFRPRRIGPDRSWGSPTFRGTLNAALKGTPVQGQADQKAPAAPSELQGTGSPSLVSQLGRLSFLPSLEETETKGNGNQDSRRIGNVKTFENFIDEASQAFDVGKNLIRAVIKAESDFNPMAKSRAGAVGLMQLLPSTARDMGVQNLYDPRENILGGTEYLGMLLERYGGNVETALAAYNWGPGNVERSPHRLPGETRSYIQKVLSYLETLTV